MVTIDASGPTFHLSAGDMSYVMTVVNGRHLAHAYWAGRLEYADRHQLIQLLGAPYTVAEPVDLSDQEASHSVWRPAPDSVSDPYQITPPPAVSPDLLPAEYPVLGTGALGIPVIVYRGADGTWAGRLEYRGHGLAPELSGPGGMPYASDVAGECQTLHVDLVDAGAGVEVRLFYTPLPGLPVVLRWARVTNAGRSVVELHQAGSASVDLPRADLDLVTLDGAWARERHVHRRPLAPGVQRVESRGGASGHQHAPFLALCEPCTTETNGAAWSVSLMYSGSHFHGVEVNQYGRARLQCGINPLGFAWSLTPGSVFDTPAAALVYSDSGFTGLSDTWHAFARSAVIPKRWREADRPVVINTWEACYFNVDAGSVAGLARRGAEIGAEVLVLDDGWFAGRTDDTQALGDWTPDPRRFADGLAPVAAAVRDAGLRFGIWVEPEMVSPNSDLFRAHPDWVLQIPGRPASLARNQLVLDLSRNDVVDHLLGVLTELLQSAPITYVKWDMNRNMSEVGSMAAPAEMQGSVMHRYMLGLYRLLTDLTRRFPEVMMEGCAGGGGRMDLGMLAHTPVFWTSDQTDAVERQPIQLGSSLLFPPETLGAHVSPVPNHETGRVTPVLTRGLTALTFAYGYELDPVELASEERRLLARLSELHKENRQLFRTGRFVRLIPGPGGAQGVTGDNAESCPAADRAFGRVGSPVSGAGRFAWAVVAPDQSRAVVCYFQTFAGANADGGYLRMYGLARGVAYRDVERGVVFDEAFLRERGIWIPPAFGDYRAAYWILERQTSKHADME